MGQRGFRDAEKRLADLSAKGDPLYAVDRSVPWESNRAGVEAAVPTADEKRRSSVDRKHVDAIAMIRIPAMQVQHDLSAEQAELQVRGRLSHPRVLRLDIEDGIPAATALWSFRKKLAKAGSIERRRGSRPRSPG